MVKQKLFIGSVGFLWLMLMTVYAHATEKAGLKFNGTDTAIFGKKACAATSEEVEIVLPNSALQNHNGFKAMIKNITQADKSRADGSCDSRIGDLARLDIQFTTGSPKIPLKKFASRAQCEENAKPSSRVLCIYDDDGGTLLSYAVFDFDVTQAKIDTIVNRSATNGTVDFTVRTKGSTSSIKVKVCYGKSSLGNIDGDNCAEPFTERLFKSSEIKVSGLENNEQYAFKIRLVDAKDGDGDWSESFTETPKLAGFALTDYQGSGGEFQFSCNSSGNGAMIFILLTLVMLFLVRLRHNHLMFYGCGLMVSRLLWTLALSAPFLSSSLKAEMGHINVGILGAMYRPDLDNETLASGEKIFPFYKCHFRRNKADKEGPINPLMGAEVDWHIWDKLGVVTFGFGGSYTYKTGKALEVDSNNQPNCDATIDGSKVSLHMYQIRPQLTYIFNPFAEYFPFVPYIRGALVGSGYMFFKNGKSESPVYNGTSLVKPNGFRFGYQGAVGMMFMMDFLEPGAVRSARGQGLLEHVYLKAELAYTKIDSFGRKGFNFSAKDVMGTNLPLLWTFGLVFELP